MTRGFFHTPNRLQNYVGTCWAMAGVFLLAFVPLRLWAATDGGQPNRRILLVVDKPNDPFVERISAELTALGFLVVAKEPAHPLETEAREVHAAAAVRLLPSRKGVEIWMADETSGRSLLRQVVVDESPDGPNQNLVALQTAELLRTSIFPKPDSDHPAKAPLVKVTPPPTEPAAPERVSSSESGAQAGLGFLYSPGGAGGALQLWMSLRHRWGKHLGLALDFDGPVHHATLSAAEGTAEVNTYLVGGEIFAHFAPSGSSFILTTGLGLAVVRVGANGKPGPSLVGTSAAVFSSAGFARVGAGWQPSRWLALGVSALAGATPERVTIRFAGNEAGTWGWPFFAAFVIAEVDWR